MGRLTIEPEAFQLAYAGRPSPPHTPRPPLYQRRNPLALSVPSESPFPARAAAARQPAPTQQPWVPAPRRDRS